MFRPIKYLSFSLLILMYSNAFSSNHLITQTEDIYLYPAIPSAVSNPTDQTINASCEVRLAKDQQHGILVRVLNGSGVFNDIHLNADDSRWISFYQSKSIAVSLNPNTQVKVTNYGEFPILVRCVNK